MAGPNWTFLTNHARVLFCLAEDPDLRLREAAERVGIAERAVQRIVTDLEEAGVLTRSLWAAQPLLCQRGGASAPPERGALHGRGLA